MHSKRELKRLTASTLEDIKYWESQAKSDYSQRKLKQCQWFLAHLKNDYPEVA